MKGSTAQVIIKALNEKRFQALTDQLATEAKGEILVKLAVYLRTTDDVSEAEISHKFGFTRGKYYHWIELLGNALASYLAGKKEAVQLEQMYQLAGELVTNTAFEAAIDLIRTGVKAAMQTEHFDLIVRFWDLEEIIPETSKIEGIDASTAKQLRANLAAFELLLDSLRHLAKNPIASQRKLAVEQLLSSALLQDQAKALSQRAAFCFWKIKAFGFALLRQYPKSIPYQEALLAHIQINSWMFFDSEHQIARETSALAQLLRLDSQTARFREVSKDLENATFTSLRANQEKAFFKFPTSIAVGIESGASDLTKVATEEFLAILGHGSSAFTPQYITENLYCCLYGSLALQSNETWIRVIKLLHRFAKQDFRPRYYPAYRFLEIIKTIEEKEWEDAIRLIKNLKASNGLEELEGMREVLTFLLATISKWSQNVAGEVFKLDNGSNMILNEITKGIDLVDYFDLPAWFEAMEKGCPMMEILHHRAISKQTV